MRYAYAKWLVEFAEEHGIGVGDGELAEVEEAEFRLHGVAAVTDRNPLSVKSDLMVTTSMLAWESDVLASVVHELLPVFEAPADGGDPDGE